MAELEREQTAGLKRGPRCAESHDGGSEYAKALKQAGATRKDAQRWQRLAGMPEG